MPVATCNCYACTVPAGNGETLPTCPYQRRQCMEGVVPLKVGQPLFAKKSNDRGVCISIVQGMIKASTFQG